MQEVYAGEAREDAINSIIQLICKIVFVAPSI